MKKVLVILALAMFSFANAQKGTVLVAGSVSYNSVTVGDADSNSFEFAPKVGYQFSDSTTLGLQTSIGSAKDNGDDKYSTFKLGAFLRYSVPLEGVFSFFTDFGVGMQSYKDNPNGPGLDEKGNGFYLNAVPAIGVNMKKGFCLNFSIGGLGYDSMKTDGAPDAVNSFGITFGKQASIGISKNF